jgi:hypothetical protein
MNITTKIGSNEYNQWKIITPSSFHHTLQYKKKSKIPQVTKKDIVCF